MEVNAWVPLTLSRDFANAFGHGSIINLHDTHLEGFDFRHAGYILSKHVLAELTRMMALALAPGITVNAVAPGCSATAAATALFGRGCNELVATGDWTSPDSLRRSGDRP